MSLKNRSFRSFFILCLALVFVITCTGFVFASEEFDGYIYKMKDEKIGKLHKAQSVEKIYDKVDEEDIEYIEPNYKIYLGDNVAEPNDEYFSLQDWIFKDMSIQNVWNKGFFGEYDGRVATVAVIDTGVSKHPDLGNILSGVRYLNGKAVDYKGDIDFHGTFVAGIISAINNNGIGISGAMPKTKIYPISVFKTNKKGEKYSTTIDLVKGIEDAIEHNVDVINLSLGSEEKTDSEEAVIKKALAHNIIVVAASGNDGKNKYYYPASINGVVSVASTNKKGKVSYFSNYNNKVVVAAPGENVVSTVPLERRAYDGYVRGSGTSFATPYVSALAAMYKTINPSGNASEFIKILKDTSTDKGAAGRDKYYGWGVVNYSKVYNHLLGKKESLETTLPIIKGVKLKKNGNNITINWTKPEREMVSSADGYQISYSNTKSFKSNKTIKISNISKSNYTVKNLKKGKKYYFRIRIHMGDKHSKWSSVHSILLK